MLVALLNYVVGSIVNIDFNLQAGIGVSLVAGLLVILIGEVIPNEEVSDY